jgi:tRNA(Ile2) C34 agmatinyltransferase TiaS
MEWIVLWFMLAIVAGVIAANKGRSGFGFFLLAIVLSPLIGIIAAAAAKSNVTNIEKEQIESGDARTCPHCAEVIKLAAKVCKHCGRDVPQITEKSVTIDPDTGMRVNSLGR